MNFLKGFIYTFGFLTLGTLVILGVISFITFGFEWIDGLINIINYVPFVEIESKSFGFTLLRIYFIVGIVGGFIYNRDKS
jgi:hypothetical protein